MAMDTRIHLRRRRSLVRRWRSKRRLIVDPDVRREPLSL